MEVLVISSVGKKNRVPLHFFLTGVAAIFSMPLACATVSLTERKRLRLIPDSQLLTLSFHRILLPQMEIPSSSPCARDGPWPHDRE